MTPEPLPSPRGLSRRDALKTLGAGAALLGLGAFPLRSAAAEANLAATSALPPAAGGAPAPFTLPKLGYAYDALEPHIDARTMEIHLTKHHQAYVTNANKALAEHPALAKLGAAGIVKELASVPESVRATLRNNVGGHLNHTLFWQVIGPAAGGAPKAELAEAITNGFGSFENFKTQFADAAMKRFGSGWAWLSVKSGELKIHSTANQDSPLMEGFTPVLGLDVWEHAYYLHYQNRRADYVTAFWQVVNWTQAGANFRAALGS